MPNGKVVGISQFGLSSAPTGGGSNQRVALCDGRLIKENPIAAADGYRARQRRRGDRRPGNHRRHPRNWAGPGRAKACVAD